MKLYTEEQLATKAEAKAKAKQNQKEFNPLLICIFFYIHMAGEIFMIL